jgi:hypothetical protein
MMNAYKFDATVLDDGTIFFPFYAELLAQEVEVIVVPKNIGKDHSGVLLSRSMQQALDDEKNGRVTKLVSHKNAVAEILG